MNLSDYQKIIRNIDSTLPAPLLPPAFGSCGRAVLTSGCNDATRIYLSGKPTSQRKDELDALIRSGRMVGEGDLNSFLGRLQALATAQPAHPPALPLATVFKSHKPGSFSTRQLIKLLGVDATYALASSWCDARLGMLMFAGYVAHGDWSTWIREAGKECGVSFWSAAMKFASANGIPIGPSAAPTTFIIPAPAVGTPVTIVATPDGVTAIPTAIDTEGVKPMTNTAAPTQGPLATTLKSIATPLKAAIDAMLQNSGASGVTLDKLADTLDFAADHINTTRKDLKDAEKQRDEALAEVAAAKVKLRAAPSAQPIVMQASGAIPKGTMKMVPADSIFPEMAGTRMEIPFWVWDAPHPHVPATIDGYIFRRPILFRLLRSIVAGEGIWLKGHTGTGKTTLVQQVAARLNWPVMRVAMDSAIDRAELVGKDQLKSDGNGGTNSNWQPGVIERSIPNGYMVIFDEIDAAHPNSLYTLQPVLERDQLTLLEDGGRIVPFHPMTRLIATGNTAGNGDESGLYPACRAMLSAATLDRFPEFIEVEYLSQDEEVKLIRAQTGVKAGIAQKIAKFATEMREAFVKREIPISFSPRRSLAFARAVEDYAAMLPSAATEDEAVTLALHGKLIQATPEEHRARVTEIARVTLQITVDPGNPTVPSLTPAAAPAEA